MDYETKMSSKDTKEEKHKKSAAASDPNQASIKVQQKRNLTDNHVGTLYFPVGNTRESNFIQIAEQLATWTAMHLPTLTSIFQDGTLKRFKQPAPPNLVEGEFGQNLAKEQMFKNESIQMFKEDQEQKHDKPKLWQVIWSVASVESENVLKKQDTWNAAFASKCPSELWLLVKRTHQVALTGLPVEDRYIANMRYNNIKMREDEKLPDFRKRYLEFVGQRKAAGCKDLEDEDDAFHYAKSLRRPYDQAVIELTNLHLLEISDFPKTADDAHTIISNLNINRYQGSSNSQVVQSQQQAMFSSVTEVTQPEYTAEEKARYAKIQKELKAKIWRKAQEKKEKKKKSKKQETSSDESSSEESTSRKSTSAKKSSKKKTHKRCGKCNRDNHHEDHCYAKTKVNDKGEIIALMVSNTYDSGEDVVF